MTISKKTQSYLLSTLIIFLILYLVVEYDNILNDQLNNTDVIVNNTDVIVNNTDVIVNNTEVIVNNTEPIRKKYLLYVNGTKILDNNKTEIILSGLVIPYQSQTKKYNSTDKISSINESWITEENISYLKNNSLNLIDISEIQIDQVIKFNGEINEDFFNNYLDHWVNLITKNKIYCIINLDGFSVVRPQDYGSYSMPDWLYDEYGGRPYTYEDQAIIIHDFWDINVTSMDDERELYYKAWGVMANRYKDNPFVMYSLVNEPLHHTYSYADRNKLQKLGIGYNSIMTNTFDHIRNQGSDQIIFIEIPYLYDDDYNWTKFMVPINRTNFVYEGHSYVDPHTSMTDWYGALDHFTDDINLKFDKPFYLGEWWIDPVSYKDELDDWKSITIIQRNYINYKNISSGFFSWGRLYGYYNWATIGTSSHLTEEEINFLEQILFDCG